MNQTYRSARTTIAVALLGVTAVGAAGFGLLAPVVGLAAADLLGGSLGSTAAVAMIGIGLLSMLLAGAAVVSARLVHAGRPSGVIMGLVLGAILIAGPAVASASGGWHPALTASVALGAAIIGALAAALPMRARS